MLKFYSLLTLFIQLGTSKEGPKNRRIGFSIKARKGRSVRRPHAGTFEVLNNTPSIYVMQLALKRALFSLKSARNALFNDSPILLQVIIKCLSLNIAVIK